MAIRPSETFNPTFWPMVVHESEILRATNVVKAMV
jgi:hypothetical protein